MTVTLCVLLWAVDGQEDALAAYEDDVLSVLARHGGRILERLRRVDGPTESPTGQPTEMQVLQLPDEAAFQAYLADPARAALGERRGRAVARTEAIPVVRLPSDTNFT